MAIKMWLLETKVCWKVVSNVETSLMNSISNNICSFASDQRDSKNSKFVPYYMAPCYHED